MPKVAAECDHTILIEWAAVMNYVLEYVNMNAAVETVGCSVKAR